MTGRLKQPLRASSAWSPPSRSEQQGRQVSSEVSGLSFQPCSLSHLLIGKSHTSRPGRLIFLTKQIPPTMLPAGLIEVSSFHCSTPKPWSPTHLFLLSQTSSDLSRNPTTLPALYTQNLAFLSHNLHCYDPVQTPASFSKQHPLAGSSGFPTLVNCH